jgi:tetratricopeptide (TPR) repeat protein
MDQNGGRRGADTVFVAWDTTTPGLRRTLEGLLVQSDGKVFVVPGIQPGSGEILRDVVVDGIRKASHVIVVVDRPNANVGFEAGLALGLGKAVTLVHYLPEPPQWLEGSLFRNYLSQGVHGVSDLERLAADERVWFRLDPPELSDEGRPLATLSLCPLRFEGETCRRALSIDRPEWKDPWEGGSRDRLNLKDLGPLVRDVDRVVWTIAQYAPNVDERDGSDNACNAIIAGWFFAREIQRASDRDTGLNWGSLRERFRVFRSDDSRRVVDVEPLEQVWTSLSEYHRLLISAFKVPQHERHPTPVHWTGESQPRTVGASSSFLECVAAIPRSVRWGALLATVLAIVLGAWFRLDRRYRKELAFLQPRGILDQPLSDLVRHQQAAASAATTLRRCPDLADKNRAAIKELYLKSQYSSAQALIKDLLKGPCGPGIGAENRCYLGIFAGNLLKLNGQFRELDQHYLAVDEQGDCRGFPNRNVDLKSKLAHRALENGQYSKALGGFEDARKLNGRGNEAADANLGLAKTLIALGRSPEALPVLEDAAKLFDKKDRLGKGHILLARADAELRQGRPRLAMACLNDALAAYGGGPDVPTVQRGNAYARLAAVEKLLGEPQADEDLALARKNLGESDPDERARVDLFDPPRKPQEGMAVLTKIVESKETLPQTRALARLERAKMIAERGSEGDPCALASVDVSSVGFDEDPVINGDRQQLGAALDVFWNCGDGAQKKLTEALASYGSADCFRSAAVHVRLGQLALRSAPANVREAEARLLAATSSCAAPLPGAGPGQIDWGSLCPARWRRSAESTSNASCHCSSSLDGASPAMDCQGPYPVELAGRLDLLAAAVRRAQGDSRGASACFDAAKAELERAEGVVGSAVVELERASQSRSSGSSRSRACDTLKREGERGWMNHFGCTQPTAASGH